MIEGGRYKPFLLVNCVDTCIEQQMEEFADGVRDDLGGHCAASVYLRNQSFGF